MLSRADSPEEGDPGGNDLFVFTIVRAAHGERFAFWQGGIEAIEFHYVNEDGQ